MGIYNLSTRAQFDVVGIYKYGIKYFGIDQAVSYLAEMESPINTIQIYSLNGSLLINKKGEVLRLEGLRKELKNVGGQETEDRLAAVDAHFDSIEAWISSEGENWNIQDLRDEHRRVFSNVIALDCPPYETLFGNDHVFGQSYVMGDIAGFYSAFGLQLSPDIHERLDHLSVELEFMHYLSYKESYAILHDGAEKLKTVVEAEKKFVKEHIGRWVPLFSGMLKRKADYGFYKILADFTTDWMAFDIAFLGVTPQPYSETDYRPAQYMNPEGQTFECGAQDKGNELSLLMNEVGADAFIDKESGATEQSGNA